MTVPFPHSPKPVQGRPFGENLHRGLHSCPCRGRKSPEIQEVIISRKALKIRHPQGCVGSTPTPGTCDSNDLGRGGGGRSGRVSPNVSPIAFATLPVRRDHHAGTGSRATLRGALVARSRKRASA